MRRLVVILIALSVAVPAVALAGEVDAPEPPPPRSLSELTNLVEDYIYSLTEVRSFAPWDRPAQRSRLIVEADLFIGTIRAEAIRYVDTSVPEPVRTIINDLQGTARVTDVFAAVNAAGADPVTTWIGQEAGLALVSLRHAIARLRSITEGLAPDRVCPVTGDQVYFEDDWGDDRPGERTHKGTDLHSPRRTPVQAIESGVVVQANWHRAGGRQIYIRADATGDVYYYAHLDYWAKWIWTGTRVEAGDIIGLLGSSGNADSPHLHFGWMPGSGRVDLENLQNAYPLLLEICR